RPEGRRRRLDLRQGRSGRAREPGHAHGQGEPAVGRRGALMSELLELAERTTARLLQLGADEAAVTVSQGTHTTIARRDGKVEQATEATTRGLVVSVLADGRYSSNSTSDLRPEALDAFLKRSVDATRYLEPDPDRALPPAELCGRGVSEAQLDQDDPTWYARTAEDRAAEALRLEQAFEAVRTPQVI